MPARPAFLLALALLAAPAVSAQSPSPSEEGRYGNPPDLDAYIAQLANPSRDAWQKPDEVVSALGLRRGQTACDIGAGPGYFTLRLARAVGPGGFVYAVDVETRMVQTLRDRLERAGVHNVAPVLALTDDPLLPAAACDVVLIVDTYHLFPNRPAYLRRLGRSLRKDGRIVNIDYQRRPTPVGPPVPYRLSRETFLEEAKAAGLALAGEHAFLPYQYFLVLKPQAAAGRGRGGR